MGQYCFARWRLLSVVVVVCNAAGRVGGRTAGQYCYVPLGRHLGVGETSCRENVLSGKRPVTV